VREREREYQRGLGWASASSPVKSRLGSGKISAAAREREGEHKDSWAGLRCRLRQAIGWEEHEGGEEGRRVFVEEQNDAVL
jgi:hypothetical protein